MKVEDDVINYLSKMILCGRELQTKWLRIVVKYVLQTVVEFHILVIRNGHITSM